MADVVATLMRERLRHLQERLSHLEARDIFPSDEQEFSSIMNKLWIVVSSKSLYKELGETLQIVYEIEDAIEKLWLTPKMVPLKWRIARHAASPLWNFYRRCISGYVPPQCETIGLLKIMNDSLSFFVAYRGEFAVTSLPGETRERVDEPLGAGGLDHENSDAVGLADDETLIREQLLDAENRPQLCAVAIVGMRGMGKTLLAKRVCANNAVQTHFKRIKYVDCSQSDWKDALKEFCHPFAEPFLILLDDVRKDDAKSVPLLGILSDARNGSRVIITSRFLDAGRIFLSHSARAYTHEMNFLNLEDSLQLFKKELLSGDEKSMDRELEYLSVEIVKRCGGLPLDLKRSGRLLSQKKPMHRDNFIALLAEDGGLNLSVLESGTPFRNIYEQLSVRAKACLLYMMTFPSGSQIHKGKLFRLWAAEFLVSREEDAEAILNHFIQRSMVQVSGRRYDGSVRVCQTRNIIGHGVASEMKAFLGFLGGGTETVRHVVPDGIDNLLDSLVLANRHLRSLRGFNLYANRPSVDMSALREFKLLQVIDLEDAPIRTLPREFGDMLLLTYLGLANTSLEELPPTLGNLCLLQTLDIQRTNIRSLPQAVWSIQTLRHIFLGWDTASPRDFLGHLRELKTLKHVAVGRWIYGSLPQLRKLSLYNIGDAAPLISSLERLTSLRSLSLKGVVMPVSQMDFSRHAFLKSLDLQGPVDDDSFILSNDKFPRYLLKLTLRKSQLKLNPLEAVSRLRYLRVLRLCSAYLGFEIVALPGVLTLLQHLVLGRLNALQRFEIKEGALPSLTTLSFVDCGVLNESPGLEFLQALEQLVLMDMPPAFVAHVRDKQMGHCELIVRPSPVDRLLKRNELPMNEQ